MNKFSVFLLGISLSFNSSVCLANYQQNTYQEQQYQQQREMLQRYSAGVSSYKNKQYDNAINNLNYCLNNINIFPSEYRNDKRINILIMIGDSYRNLNNPSTAINYLLKAYEAGNRSSLVLEGLGYCYMDLGNSYLTQAKEYMVQCCSKYPNADHFYNLTEIYDRLGDYDNTVRTALFGCQNYPQYEYFPLELARIYYNDGDWENAITYGSKACEINSNNIESLGITGISYANLNNENDAITYYEAMIKIDANHSLTKILKEKIDQLVMMRLQEQQQQQMIQDDIDRQIQNDNEITMNNQDNVAMQNISQMPVF